MSGRAGIDKMVGQHRDPAVNLPRDLPDGGEKVASSRVLVVDDEPLVRWAIAQTLSDLSYEVGEAGDAASARRAILEAEQPPDLALIDLRLPDSDDLSLAFFIRTHAPDTPIVLMTAFGTPEILEQAAAFGIPVLNKPFDMSELTALVDRTFTLRTL
jgi:DNA-binding NtrC family response regulator